MQSVTGLSPDVLLAVPALLLVLPLLAGRYVGEDGLLRLACRARVVRRRRSPSRLGARRRAPRVLPRGGRLIAAALAERAPPLRRRRAIAAGRIAAGARGVPHPPATDHAEDAPCLVSRAVAAGAALLALLAVPTAQAHQGNPNYRSVIDGVIPNTPGVKLQVLNFDDRLQLDNRSGKTVTVQGYQHEPYARLLADGTVEVNRNSPAYYLNNDRTSTGKVPAERQAGRDAELEDRRPHRLASSGTTTASTG